VFGGYDRFQTDAAWHGLLPFHEYFHGDTGAGLGASHQTGWTGLVADLVLNAYRSGLDRRGNRAMGAMGRTGPQLMDSASTGTTRPLCRNASSGTPDG